MAALSLGTNLRRFLRPPRRYVYTAALVISVARYVLLLAFFPQFTTHERLFFSALSLVFMILMWEGVDAFNRYLNRRLPFESGVLRRFFVQAGTCLAATIIVQTTVIIQFDQYCVDYFPAQFVTGIKIASYGLNVFIVLAVNTAYFGFYFFGKWKKTLVEKETWAKEKALLQKDRLNAQYDNLKNQLNPHFLFNSLSSLDGLIDEDPALARQFLQQLSKVFRYVLQNKENERVPLETELVFIRHYVSLLKTRFDGTLDVQFAITDEALEQAIVPVTLQILIENAIKHNSINENRPLTIRVTTDDGYLTVANPIQRKRQVGTSNGQGLNNLKLLYGYLSARPVTISDDGVQFAVRIPLLPTESVTRPELVPTEPTPQTLSQPTP